MLQSFAGAGVPDKSALSPARKRISFALFKDAQQMVANLEEGSLTTYDRLYWSEALVMAHIKQKNYFLIRARRSGVPVEITQFFSAKKKIQAFLFNGVWLYMIKSRNRKTDRNEVFITNLPEKLNKKDTIAQLYRLRWEVETSFRELTDTLRLEEWHSKSLNGVLQELYAALWLVNFTKAQLNFSLKLYRNPLSRVYYKPNIKLCLQYIVKELRRFLQKIRRVYDDLIRVAILSTEKRKRLSRAHPRLIRSPASPYTYNNTVWVL